MTQGMYIGGEADYLMLLGNFSTELQDIHTGTMFDVTLTQMDEPGGPIEPAPSDETETEASTTEAK